MARNEISFLVNLRKNTLTTSKSYGQYFGEAESKEPLSLKGFARHMTSHGKLADYSMVVLVLQQLVECMTEMMTQGQPVKLDGLGTFYPTIENKLAGTTTVEAYSPQEHIVGVHMRFRPENAKGEKLTSRELMKKCVFEMHDLIEAKHKTVDGKDYTYQVRTPLSTYGISQAEPDPEPDPDPDDEP